MHQQIAERLFDLPTLKLITSFIGAHRFSVAD